MEASTTRFASASIVLLLSVIAMLASANADTGYGKSQLEVPKLDTPKEHVTYEKTKPKVPTKPVVPKKEYVTYEKTKPKLPTKPVVPKEKHESYEKNYPKLPTKPVVPKKEHESYEKPNPKLPTKPVLPKGQYGSYPTKPVVPKPENKTYGKGYPKAPKVLEHPKNIAVQGLIYCKYGAKLLPLQGATARVTCLAVRKNGYESAPFSFSSTPANKMGYFLAKIPTSKFIKDDIWEITECKAFLEYSPWTSCKNAEDTNGGIKGAPLVFSRHLDSNGFCLSSVGPFIFNPGQESLPKEGY
ncbi:hypothetical protein Tco_0184997 [Tanacetum coccineum]